MKKGILKCGFAICMTVFLAFGLLGESEALFAESNNHRVVRVGFFDFPGFNDVSEKGEISGYGYEYPMEIQKYTNWEYEFVTKAEDGKSTLTYEDALKMLQDGKVDIVWTVRKTPEREEEFYFPEYSSGTNYGILTTRTGNNQYQVENIESMNGMNIGLLAGSSRNQEIKTYIEENGIKYCTFREYPDDESLSEALADSEVDAVYTSSLRKTSKEKIILSMAPSEYYFVMNKVNEEACKELSYAMEQIGINNSNLENVLRDKYYNDSSSYQISFTQDEMKYIASNPKIMIEVDRSFIPIEYYNEKTNQPDGISIKILNLIMKKTDLKFTYKIPDKYGAALQQARNRSVDILPSFASDYNWAKKVM